MPLQHSLTGSLCSLEGTHWSTAVTLQALSEPHAAFPRMTALWSLTLRGSLCSDGHHCPKVSFCSSTFLHLGAKQGLWIVFGCCIFYSLTEEGSCCGAWPGMGLGFPDGLGYRAAPHFAPGHFYRAEARFTPLSSHEPEDC